MYRAAVALAALFALTGCVSGEITNKRAPGRLGEERVFQIEVDDSVFSRQWVTVTEDVWDRCNMYEQYPACVEGSPMR